MRKFILFLLIVFVLISCKSKPAIVEEPVIIAEQVSEESAAADEPVIEIFEPVFEVISIIILQADLVVTEFETVLRIENPNSFAVDLSSITYELYGNGTFWARGSDNNMLHVPAFHSSETKFKFSMNFIDMNRRLLDDIIALRQVNYRFRGQAHVNPQIQGITSFIADFDCSGLSEVRRN